MLDTITRRLGNLWSTKTLGILVAVSAIIAVSLYVYQTYVEPRLNPSYVANSEFVEEGSKKEAELYYFFTKWCPYCKKATPIWNELKEKYENNPINNTQVYFKEVDCDENEKLADEFNIEGYPTIKLVKDGQIIEYDAKPNLETLEKFLHTTL